MTVEQVMKVAAGVTQAGDKSQWVEEPCTNTANVRRMPKGGAELEYPDAKVGENQHSNLNDNDEETGDNYCGQEAASGFVPVAGVANGAPCNQEAAPAAEDDAAENKELRPFTLEETVMIFDWDDTILPSAWVQSQGLRLDEDSKVNDNQRMQLTEVANAVMETLRIAKTMGTVVLVTNAERGWIELSCQKFLPTLYPVLENVKLLSARTTYECPSRSSPLDWKICAFDAEVHRIFGKDVVEAQSCRKNILSLGDSMHEREALLRVTASLPNCRSKSLKFVERPDISQVCKQHSLITGCFDRIVNHDGNLDVCIRCA